jgi:vancomycin resistance protein YoaR
MAMAPPIESSPAPRSKSGTLGLRIPLFLLLLGAGGGLIAHLVFAEERARAAAQLEVRALGHALLLGGEAPDAQAKALASAYLREPLTLVHEGVKISRPRQEIGVSVDRDALAELLRDAADPRSPLRKLHRQRRGRSALIVPIPAQLDAARAEPWVRAFAAKIDAPPRNTRIDITTGKVTAPSAGRVLDVEATLDAIEDAVFHGRAQAQAVVHMRDAEPTCTADKVELGGVLGSFESEQAADDAARRALLTQLARALDGALIAPGSVFDFKAQVGLTRGETPLPMGPVSLEGDRAEAAFAQVAGTIYASALFAGLTVLEQHPRAHPLATIELGLESAIDDLRNLRFKNDLSVPIALSVVAREGRVRAAIRGPIAGTREVELSRVVEVAAPFPELTHPAAGMALGVRSLVQRGLPSLHVSLTRTIRLPAPAKKGPIAIEASSEERVERDAIYLPIPRVVKVGTGGAGGAPLKADVRPELLVDEHLQLTMRPGFELPEETARREGRTGTPGWTAR